jgi:hypothetical protein
MALGDLSFALFLAPPSPAPANELAGYGCVVLTALTLWIVLCYLRSSAQHSPTNELVG